MASNIDGKYIKVQGWMATQLELYGNDLIIYAYIYSFQFKDFMGKDVPTGEIKPKEIPLRDFVEWTNISRRNVMRIIQKLEDRGLIKVINTLGKTSAYMVDKEATAKAIKGLYKTGDTRDKMSPVVANVTGDKMSPPPGQNVTSTRDKMSPVPVTKSTQTRDKMSPHLQHNYIDNKDTTSTTTRVCAREASASLSTETAPETAETAPQSHASGSDMISTMTEEEKAQVAALEAMKDGIRHGIRPRWMRSDPVKQFPEAYSFLHKDRPRLSRMEQELIRKYSAWLMCGKSEKDDRDEDEPTKEQVCTLPPPSEIGQEAYDAQKSLLQLVFGKDVTIHTAVKK